MSITAAEWEQLSTLVGAVSEHQRLIDEELVALRQHSHHMAGALQTISARLTLILARLEKAG